MIIREYNSKKDKDAVRRIWREIGWIDKNRERHVDTIMESCRSFVAELNGEAECVVTSAPGVVRYLDEDLSFACCTSAATSWIARRQGLLRRLLASRLAADAAEGGLVAGLGMFDQGFYNRLGYGTGSYEHWFRFDPSTLCVRAKPRVPRRLTRDDADLIHASRRARRREHGSVSFESMSVTTQDLIWSEKGFGLGYCDGPNGELTHHVWCTPREGSGHCHVDWVAFQTPEQLLELLAVLRSLGDQVHLIEMREPPGIQLQDLLDRPFRLRGMTEKSKFENRTDARAYWQMRMLDVPGCLSKTRLRCEEVNFNLELTDPVEAFLPEGSEWRGVAGNYAVTLGPSSGAEKGTDDSLPTLKATINAFTRLWLGVRSATGIAFTDDLSGPQELLERLDMALRLPQPKPDWDF